MARQGGDKDASIGLAPEFIVQTWAYLFPTANLPYHFVKSWFDLYVKFRRHLEENMTPKVLRQVASLWYRQIIRGGEPKFPFKNRKAVFLAHLSQ